MRTEMMTEIFEVATSLGVVEAILLNGSRATEDVPKDQFQDFDIVYFVTDNTLEELVTNRRWLEQFGSRIIMQTPGDFGTESIDYHHWFSFLMLFKNHQRIDLTLCPLSKMEEWLAAEPVGKVLYDPKGLLPKNLATTSHYYDTKPPTPKEVAECSNEFWWVSTYVVKGICRNEPFYAIDHFYQVCYQELLKMIRWTIAESADYTLNFGKNNKYLLQHVDQKTQEQLLALLDMSSLMAVRRNLGEMQELFFTYTQKYCQKTGIHWSIEEAQQVLMYTKQQLAKGSEDIIF